MLKEIDICGIYVAPFALFIVFALIAYLPCRWFFNMIRIQRWVWHRALFDFCIFVILLALIAFIYTNYGN